METKINIADILKDKPVGLKFYSNTFGYISFNGVHKDKVYFFSEDTNAHSVKPNGKMYNGGECIIFPSKTLKLDDGTVLKGVVCLENIEGAEFGDKGYLSGDCCAWVKDIVPIPITPEILEKNGWEPTKESLGHSFKNKEYPRFALWSINNKWSFTIDGVMVCNTLSCLCYVHELQHLLFGLNINHEIEV